MSTELNSDVVQVLDANIAGMSALVLLAFCSFFSLFANSLDLTISQEDLEVEEGKNVNKKKIHFCSQLTSYS